MEEILSFKINFRASFPPSEKNNKSQIIISHNLKINARIVLYGEKKIEKIIQEHVGTFCLF